MYVRCSEQWLENMMRKIERISFLRIGKSHHLADIVIDGQWQDSATDCVNLGLHWSRMIIVQNLVHWYGVTISVMPKFIIQGRFSEIDMLGTTVNNKLF
jgi:hypothetical protein